MEGTGQNKAEKDGTGDNEPEKKNPGQEAKRVRISKGESGREYTERG
jgi:hypothetical protein